MSTLALRMAFMSASTSRSAIMKKTIQFGSSTLLSRLLGMVREVLTARYLGAGVVSDAFFTAFKFPNTLRKMFAEGALTAVFVPAVVSFLRNHGKDHVNSIMTLAFIIFEGIVLMVCALCMWQAEPLIYFMAPGFSAQQLATAVPMLRILMPFIFFVSTNALLSGPLQAIGHIWIPALSPVLLNIVFIAGLVVCTMFGLPATWLCWFIVAGGAAQTVLHITGFLKLNFRFGKITKAARLSFSPVFGRFLLSMVSAGAVEIGLFIDTQFASYLPAGSVSLINYANRFMGIPLGVFAVAFSTILLPHFSRVGTYAPKRMGYYLLETSKFVLWVTVPVALLMAFFAHNIFETLYLSDKFTQVHVTKAATILIAYVAGLCFFSLNKVMISMFYALQSVWIPTVIAGIGTATNILFNVVLMARMGAAGLALATSLGAILQTILFVIILRYYFKLPFYPRAFLQFITECIAYLTVLMGLLWLTYKGLYILIERLPATLSYRLLHTIIFWVWVGPLCLTFFGAWYLVHKKSGMRLHFLE